MGQGGREAEVRRVKEKGKAVADEAGEKVAEASVDVVIRHRCTLEAVCALYDEMDDDRKRAIRDTMWSLVLEYKSFAMDGHLMQDLIECWNSDTKSFKIGMREVPLSLYDMALITGLLAHGKPILFQRNEVCGEVEGLLKGAMDDHVSHERGRGGHCRKMCEYIGTTSQCCWSYVGQIIRGIQWVCLPSCMRCWL